MLLGKVAGKFLFYVILYTLWCVTTYTPAFIRTPAPTPDLYTPPPLPLPVCDLCCNDVIIGVL